MSPHQPSSAEQAVLGATLNSIGVGTSDVADEYKTLIARLIRTETNIVISGGLCSVAAIIVIPLNYWQVISDSVEIAAFLLLAGVLCFTLMRRNAAESSALLGLTDGNDCRVVGVICDDLATHVHRRHRIDRTLEAALLNLVPLLTDEAAYQLTMKQQRGLVNTMRSTNRDLVKVVMIAASNFDFFDAIPLISKLANGKGVAKTHSEIRDLAIQVLPELISRQDRRTGESVTR